MRCSCLHNPTQEKFLVILIENERQKNHIKNSSQLRIIINSIKNSDLFIFNLNFNKLISINFNQILFSVIINRIHGTTQQASKWNSRDAVQIRATHSSPGPSAILITPSAAASVERASAQSSGRRRATPRTDTHVYTHTCAHTPVRVSAGVGRGLSAAVDQRCYRVGPDWIYFICFHNYRALRRPAICRPPPVGRPHLPPSFADRPQRRRVAMVAEEGWKVGRRKAEDAEPRSRNARERDAAREWKKGRRRDCGCEVERGRGGGWVRGGGYGKSSVRRYRLTDVRLSVVKR